MRISACVISELKNTSIELTLNSLRGNVDEIILIDTGKEDNSEYAKTKYSNCKYIRYEYQEFSFAGARNIGIGEAKGDYIFTIDSDEILVRGENLKRIINSNIVDVIYIDILQWHTYMNGKSEFQTYSLPRIFYKTDKLEYRNRLHETVSASLPENFTKYGIKRERCYIAHIGYDLEVKDMEKKLKRNLELTNKIINEGEANAYTYYHLGKLYGIMGEKDKQESAYQKSIKIGGLNNHHQNEVKIFMNMFNKKKDE